MGQKNKKLLMVLAGVAVLLVVLAAGFGLGRKYEAKNEAENQASVRVAQDGNDAARDFVGDFKVVRVIDGDTIEIAGGEKVRYIGMDTPETVDPEKPVGCFGQEASKENKLLVESQTVRLEKDVTDRDKYGRLLRYVWVSDDFINLKLVQLGFAYATAYAPDMKFQNEFLQAEQSAKKSNLGLWTACHKK